MSWDKYFLDICNLVSKNSKCMSRQIGAILVSDNTIVCTGYNGPPRGVPHCSSRYSIDPFLMEAIREKRVDTSTCPRRTLGFKSGEGLQYCIAAHAERNVLINAAREGIITKGKIMYMSCNVPCKDCLIEIINAGVNYLVVENKDSYYDEESKYLVKHSGIYIRNFNI